MVFCPVGCGLYNEGGGGRKKTHQIIGDWGFQKMEGKKSKITIAPPPPMNASLADILISHARSPNIAKYCSF